MKNPEYITEGDGFMDIKLAAPAEILGVKQTVLRMREPTVNDQLVADAMTGGDGAKEIAVLANLLDVSQDDVKKLTLRNYKRVQTAYLSFTD